ncbi:putative ribosomal protein l24e protein [Neofusicoccum parvum UCRNP2]|uniref:Putative ribosomal protein l24e protein n=1 Tax=Botryosphaeria parva (strain UCR-NP2) TaxID=1287680 RepID=R1EPC6_BOTPV|nr:putative ribosomal protein l24e protein [Neofusicoccum parvum UCRNP2]
MNTLQVGLKADLMTLAQEDEERNLELFGDLPEAKRRKFILVDDAQRGTRVRVRVMLDQVNMEEMPDSYRKNNSVYPRSYFPTQMQSPPASPRGTRFFDDPDEEKDEGSSGAMPVTVDAYRNKMRSTMVAAGQEVAPHFETRVGKRRWLERGKRAKREASP